MFGEDGPTLQDEVEPIMPKQLHQTSKLFKEDTSLDANLIAIIRPCRSDFI